MRGYGTYIMLHDCVASHDNDNGSSRTGRLNRAPAQLDARLQGEETRRSATASSV